MVAADGVRHCGPLPADGTLRAVVDLCTSLRLIQRREHGGHVDLQLPHVDKRQQENEELRKPMPQNLPVQKLEIDVPWSLGSDEYRLHSQQSFC